EEVLYQNRRKAAQLRTRVESEADPILKGKLLPRYAEQLLKAGETDEAIKQYEALLALEAKSPLPIWKASPEDKLFTLAIAHLRQGEQENCLLNHTSDSCLLPIRGGGVHRLQRGSRAALQYLKRILLIDPKHFAARWLLNIAYMTLGEYP